MLIIHADHKWRTTEGTDQWPEGDFYQSLRWEFRELSLCSSNNDVMRTISKGDDFMSRYMIETVCPHFLPCIIRSRRAAFVSGLWMSYQIKSIQCKEWRAIWGLAWWCSMTGTKIGIAAEVCVCYCSKKHGWVAPPAHARRIGNVVVAEDHEGIYWRKWQWLYFQPWLQTIEHNMQTIEHKLSGWVSRQFPVIYTEDLCPRTFVMW